MSFQPEKNDLIQLLDMFRSIAQTGLNHTDGIYDKQRYERMLDLLENKYSELIELPKQALHNQFITELGYITPKVGVNAIIVNKKGQILLEHRKDDNSWGLPGGWSDPDESPYQSVRREVREETSLQVKSEEIIHIFTRYAGEYGLPHTIYLILFYCEIGEGEIKISEESNAISYKYLDDVTTWHFNHRAMAEAGLDFWREKIKNSAS